LSSQPLCFVLIPFDVKDDPKRPGKKIDFEALYAGAIKPAIEDAGLEAVRAKEEPTLGIIHKAMFDRLLLCDFAVADITIPNPNVFYELGVRHAERNNTTLPIFADHTQPPFDVALLRALPYTLGADDEVGPAQLRALRAALGKRLAELRTLARETGAGDSPVLELAGKTQQGSLPADERLRRVKQADGALYELLSRYGGHDKTDVFRDVVTYSEHRKKELATARERKPASEGLAELRRIQESLRPMDDVEAAVIVDLYLSYRALGAFREMLALYDEMPRSLRRSVLVREQRAFALNRLASKTEKDRPLRVEAVQLLKEVVAEVGPNPETLGLLGRIHKDRWQEALAAGKKAEARGHLERAIAAYKAGFEADFRDAYPGINATTLLDIQGDPEGLRVKDRMAAVVNFAVDRRPAPLDYWDLATLLELAILENDRQKARKYADQALAAVREDWEAGTTAKNLGYVLDARRERGADIAWLEEIVADLRARARDA
jgi:tetratricopeptide (TPR) repeat protein